MNPGRIVSKVSNIERNVGRMRPIRITPPRALGGIPMTGVGVGRGGGGGGGGGNVMADLGGDPFGPLKRYIEKLPAAIFNESNLPPPEVIEYSGYKIDMNKLAACCTQYQKAIETSKKNALLEVKNAVRSGTPAPEAVSRQATIFADSALQYADKLERCVELATAGNWPKKMVEYFIDDLIANSPLSIFGEIKSFRDRARKLGKMPEE